MNQMCVALNFVLGFLKLNYDFSLVDEFTHFNFLLVGQIFGFSHQSRSEDLDLPMFDLTTLVNATGNFSEDNKLGEGGFGAVYKVTILIFWNSKSARTYPNSQSRREQKNFCLLGCSEEWPRNCREKAVGKL